jgi:hypothetical protein
MNRHGIEYVTIGGVLLAVVFFLSPVSFAAWNEGMVIKEFNYIQTNSGTATPQAAATNSFFASIRNSVSQQTGAVTLPTSSPYVPNPITVVASNQLLGAHYVYEVPYATAAALDSDFPNDTYTFNISRTYSDNTTTSFNPQVTFTSSIPYPDTAPVLTNPNWAGGKLVLDLNNASISWGQWQNPYSSDSRIEFELWEQNGAGGATMGASSTSLTWPWPLGSNVIYEAKLSFYNVSSSVTVSNSVDPAGPGLTFRAIYAKVLHFSIITTNGGTTGTCPSSISPASQIFNENGGFATITVVASNGCCWSAQKTNSWISLFGSSGCGNGSVSYLVSSASLCSLPRTGTITIGGQEFIVTQLASSPILINPSNQRFSELGGSGSIAVATCTTGTCWSVQNTNWWISVGNSAGCGNGSVDFTVQPASAGELPRSGVLMISNRNFTVSQLTVPPNLVILEARYGANGVSNNVLSVIQSNVVNNMVNMSVGNHTMGGDPTPGYVKTLFVLYQNYNGLFQTNVTEGGMLQIPNCCSQQLPMGYTQWTTGKFTSVQLSNPNISGSVADADSDGMPNLLECALGTDPNAPSLAGLPQAIMVSSDGEQYLSLSYNLDPYTIGLTYTVEVSGDLMTWNSGNGFTTQITPDGQLPVIVRDNVAISAAAERFIRLRVTGQ